MKYADGPTAQVEVLIDAPPAKVWQLVSDISLPGRFSQEFLGAEWVAPATGPAVGAVFTGRNQHEAIGTWETTSHVVRCEPERVFEWAVSDPESPSASWRFELSPDGGGTKLVQWMRIGPARSGLSPAIDRMPDREERIIERRLQEHEKNMRATIEGIKALAEGGTA